MPAAVTSVLCIRLSRCERHRLTRTAGSPVLLVGGTSQCQRQRGGNRLQASERDLRRSSHGSFRRGSVCRLADRSTQPVSSLNLHHPIPCYAAQGAKVLRAPAGLERFPESWDARELVLAEGPVFRGSHASKRLPIPHDTAAAVERQERAWSTTHRSKPASLVQCSSSQVVPSGVTHQASRAANSSKRGCRCRCQWLTKNTSK